MRSRFWLENDTTALAECVSVGSEGTAFGGPISIGVINLLVTFPVVVVLTC